MQADDLIYVTKKKKKPPQRKGVDKAATRYAIQYNKPLAHTCEVSIQFCVHKITGIKCNLTWQQDK